MNNQKEHEDEQSTREAAEAYVEEGDAKYDRKEYEGAMSDASSSIGIHPSFDAYYLRACCREQIGDFMGAIDDYTYCLQFSDNNSDDTIALKGRSDAWRELGNMQHAIDDLSEAITRSDYPHPDLYHLRSSIYALMGEDEKASIDIDIAEDRRMSPEAGRRLLWEYIFAKAQIKISEGDYQGADEEYSEGIREGDESQYASRGYLRLKHMGNMQGAIEDYTMALDSKATANRNKRYRLYGNRGIALASLGDSKGAIDDFSRAIVELCSDAEEAGIYYRLRGIEKENLGDLTGARGDWVMAQELGDDHCTHLLSREASESID